MGGDAAVVTPSESVHQPCVDGSDHTEVEALDESVEHNEVLLFLLGKTQSICTVEARFDASTADMVNASAVGDSPISTCTETIPTKCMLEDPSVVCESDPISETDSDDEGFGPLVTKPPPGNDYNNTVGLLNQRLADDTPAIQPEDEDSSVCPANGSHVRLRRAHSTKSDGLENARRQTPRRLPLGQPAAVASVISSLSTHSDLLFVVFTLFVLCGYGVAVVYRAFHPISYPLPNVDALFKPFDVSNVSAHFTSPRNGDSFTDAVIIEWQIMNFPADALRKHGPEPFEYRVFLDDTQLLFDIGFWSIESDEEEVEINKTMRHRLRPRDIPSLGEHALRLEVTFAIPGSDDELLTLVDTTPFEFTKINSTAPYLEIVSPRDGALVLGRSFTLRYEAYNVERLDVIVDHTWRMGKRHISDGNLLLRGLGTGPHSISLEAFGGNGTLVAAKEMRINLQY